MAAGASNARDKGIRLLREGSPAESIDFLVQAIELEPEDLDLYLFLGLAYAKKGDLQSSVDILEHAINLAPSSPKLHYNLGVAYHKADRITQAKEQYIRALGLDPCYDAAKKALDALLGRAA